MKSAETHPTPQRVIDAIQVLAAWAREIEAAEILVSPQGGAGFHAERQADVLLKAWEAEIRALEQHTERMANAIKEYFNRRGAKHAERPGNEYIAEMADALADYGFSVRGHDDEV